MLTKREARILRRIETGKSHGSNFILQFLERKGLATTHEDGSVVTTPAGRCALTLSKESNHE